MSPFIGTRQKSIISNGDNMERGVEFGGAADATVRTKSRHVRKIGKRMTEDAKILDFVCGKRSGVVVHGFYLIGWLRCRVDILDYN